jgi:hypothetical protein
LTPAKQKLADVNCVPIRFKPGDRILVRMFQRTSREDMKKIRRTVERWAGSHVEVLVVDCTQMEIKIEQQGQIQEGIRAGR